MCVCVCVTICMSATNETKLPAVIKTTISRSVCIYIGCWTALEILFSKIMTGFCDVTVLCGPKCHKYVSIQRLMCGVMEAIGQHVYYLIETFYSYTLTCHSMSTFVLTRKWKYNDTRFVYCLDGVWLCVYN